MDLEDGMSKPTEDQRQRYQVAVEKVFAAGGNAQPRISYHQAQIERLRDECGVIAAEAAVEAIAEEIGEDPIWVCEGCNKPLWSDDDYASGEDVTVCASCMPLDE